MTTIVVLGMHRSGTSMVSSMLHTMGVSMGTKFIEADEHNVLGYWEDRKPLEINKDILYSVKGNWKKMVTKREIEPLYDAYGTRMKNFVSDREGKTGSMLLWGFKDPRTCMTIWLWHKVLVAPRYIIVHRRQEDTIKSLLKAHGRWDWSALIQHYTQHIKAFTGIYPEAQVHYVSYDVLVKKDEYAKAATMGLASFVGCPAKVEAGFDMIKERE